MKKILVPTDFSDNARKASLYAAEIAQKSGAIIFLLHVIEPVVDKIRQPYPLHEKLEEEISKNRMSELVIAQKSISKIYPWIKIEAQLANGSITTSILDYAEKNKMDLIIMGTKGATGLKGIMSSVTAGAIGRTEIPVLAIPDEYKMEPRDAILFATNHFEENTDLLKRIVELAKLFSTPIHVAVFVDTDTADATDYLDNTRHLNHYMDFLKRSFPDASFKEKVLEGEEFEETIEKYEENKEVDIIAMITYPKSFWEKFMRKRVTKKMTFHSKIPVLAIAAK